MYSLAKFRALINRSCVIAGYKSLITNMRNFIRCLSFSELNHLTALTVLFHWLILVVSKITWKTITICPSYNRNGKCCLLCLNDKYEIATYKRDNFLNKRTEIINTCRYRGKYKLGTMD